MTKKKIIPRSISLIDFNKDNFNRRNTINEHPVLIFLKKEKRAYNVGAMIKATGMKEATVRSVLRKLVKKKLVVHKQPYFALRQ